MPTIRVIGMNCQHCVDAVTDALNSITGVTSVIVDLDSGTATYSEEMPVDAADVKLAIEEAGYTVGE